MLLPIAIMEIIRESSYAVTFRPDLPCIFELRKGKMCGQSGDGQSDPVIVQIRLDMSHMFSGSPEPNQPLSPSCS